MNREKIPAEEPKKNRIDWPTGMRPPTKATLHSGWSKQLDIGSGGGWWWDGMQMSWRAEIHRYGH